MTDFEELRLSEYSDEDLLRYIESAEPLLPSETICRIKALSSNLVVKIVSNTTGPDELAGIDMAESLSIRVPTIRRVVKHPERLYIVMDRIRGVTLDEAWPKIGWISTISISLQLRNIVKAMRSRTSSTAGALATGLCNSIWLEDFFGLPPHPTPEIITSYFAF